MARWDERDPRWIVEEREDAKNVNNWHWTERDVTEWSKGKLTNLFSSLQLGTPGDCVVSIKGVASVTGEASINNRKGKLLFFYEWTIKLEYKVELGDDEATGYVVINGISDENSSEEIELEFEKKDGDSNQLIDTAKDIFLHRERHKLVQLAEQYKESLRTDATSGMQYTPKGDNSISTPEMKPKSKANSQTTKQAPVSHGTITISLRETFLASTMDIYNCFTDASLMLAYTQRPSEADARVGGKFSMLGGIISGKYCKLLEGELIEKEWRMDDWPVGCVSNLQLKFVNSADGCQLQLEQRNVPLLMAERTKQGWEQQIFQRIKMTFGYGVSPNMSL